MTLNQLYDHALQFWGRPYIWAGDGSVLYEGGLDCSGLVQLILEPARLDPPGDQTAHSLYLHFLHEAEEGRGTLNLGGLGALAFFGKPSRIIHVGFCIDRRIMLNASGGGRDITSVEIARQHNASVKLEPILRRSDLVATIMPDYVSRGIF